MIYKNKNIYLYLSGNPVLANGADEIIYHTFVTCAVLYCKERRIFT